MHYDVWWRERGTSFLETRELFRENLEEAVQGSLTYEYLYAAFIFPPTLKFLLNDSGISLGRWIIQ